MTYPQDQGQYIAPEQQYQQAQYQQGQYPQAQYQQPQPAPAANGLAITALVVGIVAFISGAAPFWGILAGVAAIVLGALALRKRQHKVMSIIGIVGGALAAITSLITTIMLIVTLAAAGSAIEEATSTNVVSDQDGQTVADAPAGAGAEGTRDNPLPAGSTVESQDWTVTIDATNTDATALVAEGNMFNDAPAAGNVHIQVPVTATYNGTDVGTVLEISVAYVTADGAVVNSFDTLISMDDSCSALTELYAGASTTCNTYLEVPAAVDGLIRVTPGFLADDVFFALS